MFLQLTHNIIKEIRSLEQRKFRRQLGAFLTEGNKLTDDLLTQAPHLRCWRLVATEGWWATHPHHAARAEECYTATTAQMERLSLLPSPQDVLAVFRIPTEGEKSLREAVCTPTNGETEVRNTVCTPTNGEKNLVIALDEVQDPGNLGTIIRTADWFGVRHIFCSEGTADCYAPKVVQASMGALARVQLHYVDLPAWLTGQRQTGRAIYGTFMDGESLYTAPLAADGIVVMGNEGRGISDAVAACVNRRISIPSPVADPTAHVESLNVAIATAICLSEFARK